MTFNVYPILVQFDKNHVIWSKISVIRVFINTNLLQTVAQCGLTHCVTHVLCNIYNSLCKFVRAFGIQLCFNYAKLRWPFATGTWKFLKRVVAPKISEAVGKISYKYLRISIEWITYFSDKFISWWSIYWDKFGNINSKLKRVARRHQQFLKSTLVMYKW